MAPPGLPFPSAAMLSASPSHRQALSMAGPRNNDDVMDMLSQILAPQLTQKLRDASPSPEPYQPQHQHHDGHFNYASHQALQYQPQQHQQSHQQQLLPTQSQSNDLPHHSSQHSDGVMPPPFHRSLSAGYNAPGLPNPTAPQPHHSHSAFSSPFSPSSGGAFNFDSFLTSLSPSLEEDSGQSLPLPPVPSHALEEQELLHQTQHHQSQRHGSAAAPMSTLPSGPPSSMKPLPSPTSGGPGKFLRSSAASASGAINAITRFAVGPPNNETVGFAGVSGRARRGRGGGGGGRGGGRAGSGTSERRSSNNSDRDRDRDRSTPTINGGSNSSNSGSSISTNSSSGCDDRRDHDDGWSVVENKKHHHNHHHSHPIHTSHTFNPHSPTFASALSPTLMASLPSRLLPSSKLLSDGKVAGLYIRTVEFDDESGEEMVVYVLNRQSSTRS